MLPCMWIAVFFFFSFTSGNSCPGSVQYYTYNACYGVQYTIIWASIDFEFLACVYISTRPQAKLKYKCTREIRNLWMRMLWYRTTISMYYVLYKMGSLEIVSTYDIMIWTYWTINMMHPLFEDLKIHNVRNIVTGKFWTTLSLNETSNMQFQNV